MTNAKDKHVERVLHAYAETALWASTDDAGRPLDQAFDVSDLSEQALATMRGDVEDFLDACVREGLYLGEILPKQLGEDFWLTRNRHGAGFWDRGLGMLGDKLTELAIPYGECDLYVGDDNALHVA